MIDRGRLWLLFAASLVGLASFEAAFRLLEPWLGVDTGRLERLRDFVWTGGEAAQYRPRAHVVYVRRPEPRVNSLGFLDKEFPLERRPGVVRIACIGSSTTEGGNPLGREGSYPYFLRSLLRERTGQPVEVLNFGMSGWTSAEHMINYFLVVQDYAPDIVLVHEAVNDTEPRAWPGFRMDYSHYRRSWKERRDSLAFRLLVRWSDAFAAYQLRHEEAFGLSAVVVRPPQGPGVAGAGGLPPRTADAFRRNVRTIAEHVRLRGGAPVLVTMPYDPRAGEEYAVFRGAIDEHNQILRTLAAELGLVLVDLQALAQERPAALSAAFLDLVHVGPDGNRFKAEAIADALSNEGLVP